MYNILQLQCHTWVTRGQLLYFQVESVLKFMPIYLDLAHNAVVWSCIGLSDDGIALFCHNSHGTLNYDLIKSSNIYSTVCGDIFKKALKMPFHIMFSGLL